MNAASIDLVAGGLRADIEGVEDGNAELEIMVPSVRREARDRDLAEDGPMTGIFETMVSVRYRKLATALAGWTKREAKTTAMIRAKYR